MTDPWAYPAPRYLGDSGEISATVRSVTTPPDVTLGGVTHLHYLTTGSATRGLLGLYRMDLGPRSGGGAAHFHRGFSESFFILDGTVQIFDGRTWVDTVAGDFTVVPEGGIHGFRNESELPASMLILFAPGAPREGYFDALPTLGSLTEQERDEFFAAHDTFWV